MYNLFCCFRGSTSGNRSNSHTEVNRQASEVSPLRFHLQNLIQPTASRLIDWWGGDGDPDSSVSAAFCGFSCEACWALSCGMMTWMTSQGWTRSRILSVCIPWRHEFRCERSGWGRFVKHQLWKSSWTVFCVVDALHAVAKKVAQQQRKAPLPEPHLPPKKNEVNLPLFLTSVTAVPQTGSQLDTSGCSLGILFLCVSSLESSYVWPNLNYQLSSYESAEVVSPPAHYTRTYWNQNSPVNAWNVCFPSLNAISCSWWLFPLITLTLNSICLIKLKTQVAQSKIRVYFPGWRPNPATTNMALNFTECHLLTGTQERPSVPYRPLELRRKGKRGDAKRTTLVLGSCWCGFWGHRQSLVWDQDRMSLMNHSVFQQLHLNSLHLAQQGAGSGTGNLVQSSSNPGNAVSETANQTVDMIWGSFSGHQIVLLRVQFRTSLVLYLDTSSDLFPLLEFFYLTLTADAVWPYPPGPQGGAAAVSHRRASSCRSNRGKLLPSLSRYLQTAVMVQ